ncbi:Putative lipoprotein [hydrothermal vent metagenome]|uniref:Putative lipoprotein n=1 Tax=hydrothermal vent metagenome TaxID=652676 RepID=A0A1W1ELE7_9ZZZZ
MRKILILSILSLAILSSCNSKKYFKPETRDHIPAVKHSLNSNIISLNRKGATLSNGEYITKNGSGVVNLGKGYRYINESNRYILSANNLGNLKVISKSSKESVVVIRLKIPVVTASISGNIIVYLLEDNSYGIYNISNNLKLWEDKSQKVFAIDRRVANPIFVGNSIILPTLDGKLLTLKANNKNATTTIYISAEKSFNNAIILQKVGNKIITASSHEIMTLQNGVENRLRVDISEVIIANNSIYIFTKSGKIIRTNMNLKEINSVKFDFAHYSVVGTYNNRLFALDFQGSLVVLNSDLSKKRIYKFENVDKYTFISNGRLFKNKEVISLDTLNYE